MLSELTNIIRGKEPRVGTPAERAMGQAMRPEPSTSSNPATVKGPWVPRFTSFDEEGGE